jgi:hypothetical protein
VGSEGAGGKPGASKKAAGASEAETTPGGASTAIPPTERPPITNVWLIDLSGGSLGQATSKPVLDPYLARDLLPQGTLLSSYTLPARAELANDIALLSGQGPNAASEADCPVYSEVIPPTLTGASGLASGTGCVYPHAVQTLADELTAASETWRAYVQGLGASNCPHPTIGASDPTHAPVPGTGYLGFRNPFVYFHSLLDGGACASGDVDLGALAGDLAQPAQTPNLSWIVPSACADGSSVPCAPGAGAGLAAADGFLHAQLPAILATAAYRRHGLVVITFDSGASGKAGSPGKSPATASRSRVGALLLSPFVRSGARVSSAYDEYSLLKSLERIFGVPLLGHAADPRVQEFDARVFRPTKRAAHTASHGRPAAPDPGARRSLG